MISVLIVEDDQMVAKLNKHYVESVQGFEVVGVANDGEKAWKFINHNNVDLIILDIHMAKVDGLAFLKEMRKKLIQADVIFVTAAQESETIDEGLKLGAVDYLIKPFEYERMKSALENYERRYHLLRKEHVIKQEDIDKITTKNPTHNQRPLPKGLHEKTLKKVRRYMQDHKDELLTSDEVAAELEFSRVTVRRYLEYLVSIGELTLEIEYGSIGRPSNKYKMRLNSEGVSVPTEL
ncbi:response regulator receiver and unknown domain protein [Alkaliphilus metalliredigens QYMF]|uniref:Transcriptional regulatory protein n=1 Tax=Alkaliphilus metalliredigens (strain QYMF) TaxID=293826 RepID=A6TMU0_ALKMQ|nr:response regulator [Alkaliphilus metalliredigens]ABR47508.1 response regulator receiver and unknown domain protein [Alkaliphilus metalliredigens QYMF]